MNTPCILWGGKPCGCMGIAMVIDQDTDPAHIASVKRKIKRRGYKLEHLSREEAKARPWQCPEHKALRLRLASEKSGS